MGNCVKTSNDTNPTIYILFRTFVYFLRNSLSKYFSKNVFTKTVFLPNL